MSYITAKKHLEENNLDDRIIEFNTSTATVALAAKALGVSDGEIAKSMSFIVCIWITTYYGYVCIMKENTV